jgi:hypothetical protein
MQGELFNMDINASTVTYEANTVPTLTRALLSLAYRHGMLGITIIVVCVIIVGNAITIAAVVCTRKLRNAPTNILLVNLALADELVGWLLGVTLVLPFLLKTESALRASVCLIRAPWYTTITTSTYTLLAIAFDRYYAVLHPLSYKTSITTKRVLVMSSLIWLSQLIIVGGTTCYYGITVTPVARIATSSIKDLIPTNVFIWVILPQIYIPLIGNIILYGCICVSIRKRVKVSGTPNGGTSRPDKMVTAVTKMMCMVLGYLIVAWLPYFSLTYIYSYDDVIPFWFLYSIDAATMLVYTNSAINPFIYSWHHKNFKEAYSRILKCQRTTLEPQNTTNTY